MRLLSDNAAAQDTAGSDDISHWHGCVCLSCGVGIEYEKQEDGSYLLTSFAENNAFQGDANGEVGQPLSPGAPVNSTTVQGSSAGFDYSFNLTDESGEAAEFIEPVLEMMDAVMQRWGDFLSGEGSIDLQINIESFADRGGLVLASAGPTSLYFLGFDEGNRVFEAGTGLELRTGQDRNGSAPDGVVNIGLEFLQDYAYFDPDPLDDQTTVPADRIDLYSVLLHEVLHALGFIGFRDAETFLAEEGDVSTFDTFVEFDETDRPVFTGAASVEEYGAPVPLESERGPGSAVYHFADEDGPREDLSNSLQSAAIEFGERDIIGSLELAVLRDLRLDVVIPEDLPLVDFRDGGLTPELSIDTVTFNESDAVAVIEVERSGLASGLPSVGYEVISGTAVEGEDFEATEGRFVFAPQTLEGTFEIPLIEDGLEEVTETFQIRLFNPANSALPNAGLEQFFTITLTDSTATVGEVPVVAEATKNVFRFYDTKRSVHLLTAVESEQDRLIAGENFSLEQVAFEVPERGGSFVFRFRNTETGGYQLTTEDEDFDEAMADPDVMLEGVAFSAYTEELEGTVPVFELRNTVNDSHLYTVNTAEVAFIQDNLSNFEDLGIAFYAVPNDPSDDQRALQALTDEDDDDLLFPDRVATATAMDNLMTTAEEPSTMPVASEPGQGSEDLGDPGLWLI